MKVIISNAESHGEEASRELRCPYCGTADVRPSKSAGLLDAIWASFGRDPFRCRSCRRRFHVRAETIRDPLL